LSNFKFILSLVLATVILVALVLPVFAIQYSLGVTSGQYVKYGNFAGSGPGYEAFNDYGFLNLQVVSVSGNAVTLLSTGQFKNGTALPGNNTVDIWNIETGTDNGTPSTQGPIIAANLNQGDAIPPPNTYSVNQTVDGTYLGATRSVNILNVTISTSDYNSTLNYVYDKASGMLLESSSTTVTQAQPQPITSTYSYSITATNIFSSTSPSPTVPEFSTQITAVTIALIAVITTGLIIMRRKLPRQQNMTNKLILITRLELNPEGMLILRFVR
jgi:hypothetical protein